MTAGTALDRLRDIVGDDHVLTDRDVVGPMTIDWTGRFRGDADAVVRPADTNQVAAIVRTCRQTGTAVFTQGGNTGMVGGAVPRRPGVVLSTARLADVGTVEHGQLESGAGATLAAVQQAAARAGWEYPIDLGARDSATIGGTVATNAGGVRVVRHGMTRRHVVGIECVTGAGELLRDLRGLVKDNTGYHLPSLLCGSEGTLAVLTRVRLQLIAPPAETATALVPALTDEDAVAMAERLALDTNITAVEYMRADGWELVAEHLGTTPPMATWPAALLVEAQGDPGAAERLVELITVVADTSGAAQALLGTSASDRQRLWRWREAHSEAVATRGVAHKLDVSVGPGRLAEFLDRLDAHVAAVRPDADVWVFGHLGDGNLHVNLTGLEVDDAAADTAVLDLVTELEGSISAEHGIGRAKRDHLHRNRSPEERAVFARIKTAFDPDGILNPDILIPLPSTKPG